MNENKSLDNIKITTDFKSEPVSGYNISNSENNKVIKEAVSHYNKKIINMKNNTAYLKKRLKNKNKKVRIFLTFYLL